MSILCGIDVGTSSLKVGLFTPAGEALAVHSVEYALQTPHEGFAEMPGEAYLEALREAFGRCCGEAGCGPSDVLALSVSSTGQAFLLLDSEGRELTPMIVWLDRRGEPFLEELRQRFDEQTYYAVTGIPQYAPFTTAPKLMWFRRHRPHLLASAARILMIDAYVIWRLTAQAVGSIANVGSTGMWDYRRGCWWEEMAEFVGVDPRKFSGAAPPGTVAGTVTGEAAAQTGLAEGTIVAVSTNDQWAAMVGAGNVAPGMFTESTGTAMAVMTLVEEPADRGTEGPHKGAGVIPGYCAVLSFCNTSGILLKWLRESLGFEESYDEMSRLAARSGPGARGLTVCPHFEGTLFPEPLPGASGIIAGLRLRHDRADLFRAFFEAVAFALRENAEYLAAGGRIEVIRSIGGAAVNPFWLQMKADVTGARVEKPVCQEAAVLGDALIAGSAAGLYESLADAAREAVKVERTFEPNPELAEAYEEAFRRYRDLIRRNYLAPGE